MTVGQLRFVVAGLMMVLAAGAAYGLKPGKIAQDRTHVNLENMIPAEFDDWRIDRTIIPVKPSPDVQANLDRIYDQIVSRTYVNAQGERMMLSVAYGGDQGLTLKAHRQEVCYAAQGFEIRGLIGATLAIGRSAIPVTRMLAVSGSRSEPVTYWFTMGDQVVLSRFDRLMTQLRYGLLGEIPDGMLVRVSNISTQTDRSYQAHAEFLNSLFAHMKHEDALKLSGAVNL